MRQRRFFLIVLGLLLLLHGYIGWRLLPALALGFGGTLVGIVLLALSCVLLPLGLLARFIPRQPLADRLAWFGLIAMGLFSSLLVLTVLRDVALAVIALALPHLYSTFATTSALAVPILTVLVTLIGFFNARRRARIVAVDIPVANLPDALHGFTIAQISDIHVGPTIKRNYLQAIVDTVNTMEVDLIAVTGDLVDGSVAQLSAHTQPLAQLTARHGTYFVTGNHEYYSDANAWIAELTRLNVQVLLNEHRILQHDGAELLVGGVTDYNAHGFDDTHRSDPLAAIANAPGSVDFKLLLAHQPRSASAAAAAGFDLQLSGHTHGGQFWPWNYFVRFQQPYTAGLHRLEQLWVYTSRGTGYWGPPKRFGAPSEITRIRLVRAAN
ncbi:MAG TPA: metallophosphoesterase [Spongiibacteraceae bacterium]|nr:metallophosphoesterase [Spongiibacteraceae bacterium]